MLCRHKDRGLTADTQRFWHPDTRPDIEAASHHGIDYTKDLNCKHCHDHEEKEHYKDYHLQQRVGVSSESAGLSWQFCCQQATARDPRHQPLPADAAGSSETPCMPCSTRHSHAMLQADVCTAHRGLRSLSSPEAMIKVPGEVRCKDECLKLQQNTSYIYVWFCNLPKKRNGTEARQDCWSPADIPGQ